MAARAGRETRAILLTGATGQVGWELRRTLAPLGEVIAPGRDELDLEHERKLRRLVRETAPALIVNAAAYTAVDKAEEEPELAMAVNGAAPGWLAQEAARLRIPIVHYSTDYVFGADGPPPGPRPYREGDPPAPVNAYGRTKLAGEKAIAEAQAPHLVFRTGWIYAARGQNFLLTIRRLARERPELRIVDDQVGAPTWARMVAETTAQVLARAWAPGAADLLSGLGGLYHLTAAGRTSWYGFARAIVATMRRARDPDLVVRKIVPVSSEEFPRPARRPAYSVLDNRALHRAFAMSVPDWRTQLRLCLDG